MEYSQEIIIDKPRDEVVALFDEPQNLFKWQDGLISFDHVSGEEGQPGAKSKLVYDMNGRTIEMVETILSRNLPHEFSATYETNGVFNRIDNKFFEAGADKTRWVTENTFQFGGLMRFMAFFMRGSFRKQTLENMQRFKAFAED